MIRLWRLAFWAAALLGLTLALMPRPPQLPGSPSDKVQHVLAFLTLGGLAAIAYPVSSTVKLLAGLSAFGALIEILQAIPALHRDSSFLDWVADTVAAAIILGIAAWLRSRRT